MGYLRGVSQVMKEVTWPSAKTTNRYTWIVIVSIVFFGSYFALTDTAFNELMNWLLALNS